LNRLEVFYQRVQNIIELASRQSQLLVVVHVCFRRIGNIPESTNQVEIAQVTQRRSFRYRGLQGTRGIIRGLFCHLGSIFYNQVTTVDYAIKLLPFRVGIVRPQVFLKDIGQIDIRIHVVARHDIVRTHFAPNHKTVHEVATLHRRVTAAYHIVHIAFLVPEILQHDIIQRLDVQKIPTTGK